jgi:hypothetical protein
MENDYKVKGSSIVSKFDFVEEHFGDEARDKLQRLFDRHGLFPINPAGWYPFNLYVEVLEAVAESFFDGDLTRLEEVGTYSARASLKGVYKSFVVEKEKNFLDFLSRMSALHRMFYSRGQLDVSVREDGRGCELWQRDKPGFREADLFVAKGFYTEAARMHEIDNIEITFAVEGEDAHFSMTWA